MKPSNRIIRDTANTEMLDYFSAFLTVLTSLMVCVIRFLGPEDNKVGNSIDRELTQELLKFWLNMISLIIS